MKLDIIGQRLRKVRELIGVSRQEIQDKYNFSANTIKVWETGKTEIGIIRLAKYLDIFKEFGVFLNINSFINSRDDCLDKITISSRNDFTYNPSNQVVSPNLGNSKDLQLISDAIMNFVGPILGEKEEMLRALFDNLLLKIVFKDENNNILRLNNLAAQDLVGIVSDFEGKNVYNLFPQRAEKYHQDDLEALKTNKNLTMEYEVTPVNSMSSKMISVTRTPIFSRENKKMILIVFGDR